MFRKNTSLWTCSGVAAYYVRTYVKSIVIYMLCTVQNETHSHPARARCWWSQTETCRSILLRILM